MNKENIKAWLGLNRQDAIINLSAIPFLFGFFSRNMIVVICLYLITIILDVIGLRIYFTQKNEKIGKKTAFLNKWLTLFVVLVIWALIVLDILVTMSF